MCRCWVEGLEDGFMISKSRKVCVDTDCSLSEVDSEVLEGGGYPIHR